MSKIHYEVNGLINSQKKTQVKNVLGDLDGVSKVNVDLDRGSVEVQYDDGATDEEEIRQKIEHVGCKVEQ